MFLVGVMVYDYFQKKQIDASLNNAKLLISKVALSLSTEDAQAPVSIASGYLAENAPAISNITIYPNNQLEITINKIFFDNGSKKFTFSFNSLDELTRGNLRCLSGNVRIGILPNQCRQ